MPFCICAVHLLEGFSWDYKAPNMEFYWNSTQTTEFLKVFLSLLDNIVICEISIQKQPDVFCKKGVLRNFGKFTEKHLLQSLVFNKVAD